MNFKILIKKAFGWRDGSILYFNAVNENIFVALYILLIKGAQSDTVVWELFIFYLLSFLATSYGYLINDWADRNVDTSQGKPNTFSDVSGGWALLLIAVPFCTANLLAAMLIHHRGFLWLWLLWLLLATFYSLPPLRLKNRGFFGLFSVVLAQRVLPIGLLVSVLNFYSGIDLFFLFLYILIRGFASDINHQLEDYWNDMQAGIETFVVRFGRVPALNVFRWILELEKFVLLILLIRLSILVEFKFLALPILIFYILIYAVVQISILKNGWKNPFDPHEKNFSQFIHLAFPNVVLPVWFVIFLIGKNFYFLWILGAILLTRKLYRIEVWKRSYPVQLFKHLFQ